MPKKVSIVDENIETFLNVVPNAMGFLSERRGVLIPKPFKSWQQTHLSMMLKTELWEYGWRYDVRGLARLNILNDLGDFRLDIVAILSRNPGNHNVSALIAKLKTIYPSIGVWNFHEKWFKDWFLRIGFEESTQVFRNEPMKGVIWHKN